VQTAHPAVTRRRRDADCIRKRAVGHAGVTVQKDQNPPIDVVDLGGPNILRRTRPSRCHNR
jgi:hypothetical protein